MRELLRQLLITLLLISLVILSHVVVSASPKTTPNEDGAAEIMQAARDSLTQLSVLITHQKQSAKNSLELIVQLNENSIEQHKNAVKLAYEIIREVEAGTGPTTQSVNVLKQNETSIKTTLTKKEEALKNFQDLAHHLASLESTRQLLEQISKDRTLAATIAELIHSNNRAALALLLKANTPTNTGSLTSTNTQNANTPIEVSDAKDTNGMSMSFRFNGATHCLSTRLQCSGKSYSVTK